MTAAPSAHAASTHQRRARAERMGSSLPTRSRFAGNRADSCGIHRIRCMRCPALVLVPLVLLAVAAPVASAATPPRTVRLLSGGTSSTICPSFGGQMSADGSRIVFSTTESLLPADRTPTQTSTPGTATARCSWSAPARRGASRRRSAAVSADGERVWYSTRGTDLPADTDAQTGRLRAAAQTARCGRSPPATAPTRRLLRGASADSGDHVVCPAARQSPGRATRTAQNDLYDRRADGSHPARDAGHGRSASSPSSAIAWR